MQTGQFANNLVKQFVSQLQLHYHVSLLESVLAVIQMLLAKPEFQKPQSILTITND